MDDSDPESIEAYPWFKDVDDPQLAQGDFLMGFPVVVLRPPFESLLDENRLNSVVQIYDVIVLTQSCDLFVGKTENVLVCPHFFPSDIAGIKETESKGGRTRIQKGALPSLHVLPPCSMDGADPSCRIVNFRQVVSVPLTLVQAHVERNPRRLRLLPPYREQMAQAFGRFVMRVGLPVDFEIG